MSEEMTFEMGLKGVGVCQREGWRQRPSEKVWKVLRCPEETKRFPQLELGCTWEDSVPKSLLGELEGKRA